MQKKSKTFSLSESEILTIKNSLMLSRYFFSRNIDELNKNLDVVDLNVNENNIVNEIDIIIEKLNQAEAFGLSCLVQLKF